jgi:uncharacterized membrane protein YGL010W
MIIKRWLLHRDISDYSSLNQLIYSAVDNSLSLGSCHFPIIIVSGMGWLRKISIIKIKSNIFYLFNLMLEQIMLDVRDSLLTFVLSVAFEWVIASFVWKQSRSILSWDVKLVSRCFSLTCYHYSCDALPYLLYHAQCLAKCTNLGTNLI